MNEEAAALIIAEAIRELTHAVRANTAAMLLDPSRGGVKADEMEEAVWLAGQLEASTPDKRA